MVEALSLSGKQNLLPRQNLRDVRSLPAIQSDFMKGGTCRAVGERVIGPLERSPTESAARRQVTPELDFPISILRMLSYPAQTQKSTPVMVYSTECVVGSNSRQFVPLIRKVAAGQAVIESRRGDYIPANRHESSLMYAAETL